MGLFKKAAPAPTTVAEAIAPFRQVQANLAEVLGLAIARKGEAARRIDDAKAYAASVEQTEGEAAAAADAELKQAERIAAALSKLLGDDEPSQETLRREQASAHV